MGITKEGLYFYIHNCKTEDHGRRSRSHMGHKAKTFFSLKVFFQDSRKKDLLFNYFRTYSSLYSGIYNLISFFPRMGQQSKCSVVFGMLSLQEIHVTSLLPRLQAQTLPDEAPPMGKTQPFNKIALGDLESPSKL